jgi:hypothetical protein
LLFGFTLARTEKGWTALPAIDQISFLTGKKILILKNRLGTTNLVNKKSMLR